MADKFITKDAPLIGRVSFVVSMPNATWFWAEVSDLLLDMTIAQNWTKRGDVSIQDAVDASIAMYMRFGPMIGQILPYVSSIAPDNCLDCDGAAYRRVDYPSLYAVMDAAFIVDADNFIVPDLRGRTIIGASASYAVGVSDGEKEHILTTAEMPAHSHTDTGHAHMTGNSLLLGTSAPPPLDALGPNPIPAFTGSSSANLTNTGGGGAHNNMQPYLALKYAVIAR